MWPAGQSCSVFLAHVCTLMLCLRASAFSFEKERFLWHAPKDGPPHCPTQLVADISKRSDHLLSHYSFCKWLQQLKLLFFPLSHCFFSTDFWLTGTLGQPNAVHFPWYKSVRAVHCSYLFNPQELVLYRSTLSLCFVPADVIFQASSLYSVK